MLLFFSSFTLVNEVLNELFKEVFNEVLTVLFVFILFKFVVSAATSSSFSLSDNELLFSLLNSMSVLFNVVDKLRLSLKNEILFEFLSSLFFEINSELYFSVNNC